jgi:Phosphotransferase enzyme family
VSSQRILIKSDLLGTVTLCHTESGQQIERDVAAARWWTRWLAQRLAQREQRALRHLAGQWGIATVLTASTRKLTRTYLPGQPMHLAKPKDPGYFRRAQHLLRALHRRGAAHNDLAKEANWLVTPQGDPALVDFQLATISRRRGAIFRALAYEDIRHLLKHKRTYCPEQLSARERCILATPSLPSRLWRVGVKPIYRFITRRVFGWADREGAGDRRFN